MANLMDSFTKGQDAFASAKRSYKDVNEAREASKALPVGTKITIGGVPAEITEPGRQRGLGAPKGVRFLASVTT